MDVSDFFASICASWEWSPGKYPRIPPAGDPSCAEERTMFMIRHIAHHVSKAGGFLAQEAERFDHTGSLPLTEIFHTIAAKLIIQGVGLAAAVHVSPERLESEIQRVLAEANTHF